MDGRDKIGSQDGHATVKPGILQAGKQLGGEEYHDKIATQLLHGLGQAVGHIGIGAVTPPLGVTLITSGKILGIRIEDTFPDALYVILAMVVALIIVMLCPPIVTFLPDLLSG